MGGQYAGEQPVVRWTVAVHRSTRAIQDRWSSGAGRVAEQALDASRVDEDVKVEAHRIRMHLELLGY